MLLLLALSSADSVGYFGLPYFHDAISLMPFYMMDIDFAFSMNSRLSLTRHLRRAVMPHAMPATSAA